MESVLMFLISFVHGYILFTPVILWRLVVSFKLFSVVLLVLKQRYSGMTMSIPWLLMPWFFASPGIQQLWYWHMHDTLALIVHREGLQSSAQTQCQEVTENANTFYVSYNKFRLTMFHIPQVHNNIFNKCTNFGVAVIILVILVMMYFIFYFVLFMKKRKNSLEIFQFIQITQGFTWLKMN